MHIEGLGRRYVRWMLALVLGGCGDAEPTTPDASDPPPVIGPWSCTRESSCTEYSWLPRWEFMSEARSCPRWVAARCAPQSPTGVPFFGRCNVARDTRYPSPRAEVIYGTSESLRASYREGCLPNQWEDSY